HVGDGNWSLEQPARWAIGSDGIHPIEAEKIVHLGHDAVVEVEGEHLSIADLRREIAVMQERGLDPTAFRVDLAIKLASPLACLLLPAVPDARTHARRERGGGRRLGAARGGRRLARLRRGGLAVARRLRSRGRARRRGGGARGPHARLRARLAMRARAPRSASLTPPPAAPDI